MKILIRGARLVDPANNVDEKLDILVEEGVVQQTGRGIKTAGARHEVIEASGLIVAPGLIDVHAHLREPGFEYKETIGTGTRAAVKGGFTTLACMANTEPVNDNKSVTDYIVKKAGTEGACRVFPYGAITKGLKGEELAEIGEMYEAGIVGISDDGKSVRNAGLLRKAFEYAKLFGIPVVSHCEDPDLATGFVHEGESSLLSGLEATPAIAEEVMVLRDMAIARYAGSRLHLTHISAKESVAAIGHAKKLFEGLTCDTCPHYFTLTDEATLGFDTNTKVNPPLRSKEDVEAVIEGLRSSAIDIIATDHAPHEFTSKDVEFNLATSGISGLETAFALSLDLVHRGILTLPDLLRKLTVMPARLLGLPFGNLAPGSPADLIIFDPQLEWVVDRTSFLSKGKNTPFHGWRLKGKNLFTMVKGVVAYRDPAFH